MWPLADLGRGVLDGQTTTAADVVVRLATELIFFWVRSGAWSSGRVEARRPPELAMDMDREGRRGWRKLWLRAPEDGDGPPNVTSPGPGRRVRWRRSWRQTRRVSAKRILSHPRAAALSKVVRGRWIISVMRRNGWMGSVCGWFVPTMTLGFVSSPKTKIFQDFSSHRILRHINEALNIDENKN